MLHAAFVRSHIAHGLGDNPRAESPISLLRQAYGI
jgi:hypothetical protein